MGNTSLFGPHPFCVGVKVQEKVKDQWRAFFATAQPPSAVRPLIVDSWQRSHAAQVDPIAAHPVFHKVAPNDLERRRAACADLIDCASVHIQWLSATLSKVRHAVYLTDEDGVVLFSAGDERIRSEFGLLPGYRWCESLMGTNGAGTALVEGKPVAVFGAEHYVEAFQESTCTAAPIRNPDGRVVGAVDITSATEDATPDRLTLVSHVTFVIEQELKLRQEQRRAVQENQQKDEFLAVLAHELRGPLSAIRSGAEIVKASCGSNEVLFETGKMLSRQTRLLDVLVSDLLDVARVTKGRIELSRQLLDIRQCVADALEGCQDSVARKRQELQVSAPTEPLLAEVDPTRVTEMVTNLISNASRYSPEGSTIRVNLEPRDRTVLIAVKDNGVGIDATRISSIFDAFVTGRDGAGEKSLGLGLWLTRRFAELHGGSVSVHSPGVGKGAEFRIELPTRSAQRAAARAAHAPGGAP